MRTVTLFVSCCLLGQAAFSPILASAGSAAPSQAQRPAAWRTAALAFEANQGQADPQVKFISVSRQHRLLLAPTEINLSLPEGGATGLRMKPLEANPAPVLVGRERLLAKS